MNLRVGGRYAFPYDPVAPAARFETTRHIRAVHTLRKTVGLPPYNPERKRKNVYPPHPRRFPVFSTIPAFSRVLDNLSISPRRARFHAHQSLMSLKKQIFEIAPEIAPFSTSKQT